MVRGFMVGDSAVRGSMAADSTVVLLAIIATGLADFMLDDFTAGDSITMASAEA